MRYYSTMIQSFKSEDAEKMLHGVFSKKFPPSLQGVMQRKLRMLNAAERLEVLRFPPGNRLEALKGSRKGQHSIRVNQQFRICFRWEEAGPEQVEIVDYH